MSWKSTQLSFKLIFVTSLKGYNYPEMCKQVFIKQETVFPKKQSFYPRGRATPTVLVHGKDKGGQWPGTDSGIIIAFISFLSSAAQLCSTLCDPMDYSTPRLPVHHQLPEFTQTHVHLVCDAIQPSHPVIPSSSCPQSFPASGSFPMSQFFTSGGQSVGVSASVSALPMNIQD